MAYLNGRLPRIALAPITKAANGEQAYLRKDVAKAFLAMNAESVQRFGVTLRPTSARTAYRPIADQNYFWDQYLHHGGNLAARPGFSNHGWGLAVDFADEEMRRIVDKIGAKYGFAKKWSDAPTEWWHIKWKSGVWNGEGGTDPVLHQGQTGPSVVRLKKLLYDKGIRNFSTAKSSNRYDPYFSQYTKSAVKQFQRAHGLTADGVVGLSTWAKLRS